MPGFVDAHTHPVFAGNRAAEFEQRIEGASYAEIAARGRRHPIHGARKPGGERRSTAGCRAKVRIAGSTRRNHHH